MSGWLLAMESGGVMSSAALVSGAGGLWFAQTESGQSHSSGLLPMAQRLLHDAGLDWSALDGIAVGAGPGSFTGLRIACGIAQGLSLGCGKKLLAVSGFEAWAYAWWCTHGRSLPQSFDMSFDARLGERFAARLRFDADAQVNAHHGQCEHPPHPRNDRVVCSWERTPAVVAVADGMTHNMAHDLTNNIMKQASYEAIYDPTPESIDAPGLPLAVWIARYATDAAFTHRHAWVDAADLRPLYVRDKVAQTLQERQELADLTWSDMTEPDLASVMVIERQAYPFPWSPGNFLDSLKAGYTMRVLKERGVMIGYVVWMRVLDEIHLLNIALTPARQGRGLGSWMMRQFIHQARAQSAVQTAVQSPVLDGPQGSGTEGIFLEVRPSNIGAIHLYQKYGFREIGQRKGYYPNSVISGQTREDAIVMKLELPANSQSLKPSPSHQHA